MPSLLLRTPKPVKQYRECVNDMLKANAATWLLVTTFYVFLAQPLLCLLQSLLELRMSEEPPQARVADVEDRAAVGVLSAI